MSRLSSNIFGDDAANLLAPSPAVRPPSLATPEGLRSFGDVPATRKAIYDTVFQTASNLQPTSNQQYTLRLADVNWADPDHFTKKQHKEAVLGGNSLGRRLKGTWELLENASGKVVDRKTGVVARVPHLTDGGTFIHNGVEYSLTSQPRLKAGVYTRRKDNGEVESHANVLANGPAHRYWLDPEKGVFNVKIGQANIPALPLLQALGASEKELRDAWGNDLYGTNYTKSDGTALAKIIDKFHVKVEEGQKPHEAVRAAFEKMTMDPEVNTRTLGQPHDSLNKDTVLAITKKLLDVAHHKAEVDDRDHLAYQHFMGPEELFSERLAKDRAGVRRLLLYKLTRDGNLGRMPASPLQGQLDSALLDSGLGRALEEVGPQEILDKNTQVTRMGEGGIPSLDSVPDEARNVSPSHFGFIDPLRTPESLHAGVDTYMSGNVRKGPNGQIYGGFQDLRTGREVWKTPQEMADATVTFPGALNLPYKRVPVMQAGKMGYATRDQIDYVLPDMARAFSPLGNLVPLKSMTKGQRIAMASRMATQALPLSEPEAPLVQNALPGTDGQRSYEDEYGRHMGAIHAEQGGKVVAVNPEAITVRYDDGRTADVELYNNHPYNRKSVTGDTRVVVKRPTGELWEGAIADYKHVIDTSVLSIDPDTGKSTWQRITKFIKHENDKRLVRVTTQSGRHVDVTIDHSLVTLDDAGRLQPIYPLDCVCGRTRLPIANIPTSSSQLRISADWGRLCGLYLAEGHIPTQAGLVMLAAQACSHKAAILDLLKRLGIRAYATGGNVCFTDYEIRSELQRLCGKTSGGKFIAVEMLNWPRKALEGLVEGYFGGDGCLWTDSNDAIQVTAVTTSEQLRTGLLNILSRLGVFATLFSAPRRCLNVAWADGYGLRVISKHLAKLPRWFFYEDREQKFQAALKPRYRASPFEAIPVVNKAARKRLYAGFAKTPTAVQKQAVMGFAFKPRVSESSSVFGAWGRSDVMWDVVTAITPIPAQAQVYDFCVEASEVFAVNNGLVVHNTFLHQTPLLTPGERFSSGQLLARSNFTDKQGTTALGANARVAYTPWGGKNFEDAVVISESMAKRLTSEHAYQHQLELDDRTRMGRRNYLSLFPSRFDKKTLGTLDDQGVVKPGTTVRCGDPLIVAAREKSTTANKIHKKGQKGFADASVTWEQSDDGVVTDVVQSKNGPVVVVKSKHPMKEGDKLSGRFGDKGVISAIVPDTQMPHDQQGQPFEVLLNPLGLISRTNAGQWAEAKLGAIAAKTGQAIKAEDFHAGIPDYSEWVRQQMAQHGIPDTEDIIDPVRGTKIPNVFTGNRFFMKLVHMAEDKGQGRSGGGYAADETPAKGGEGGSKRMALMDINALLSHGGTEIIRDAGTIRGQKNDDYWLQFLSGHTPRQPKVPMVYQKFVDQLKASGINVVRDGSQLHIMALTDKDVDKLAGDRNVQHGETVDLRGDLKPVKGGLFDEGLTGGHHGSQWSAYPLHEPLPNPTMEEPIRRVLGLTQQKFEDVLAGKEKLAGGTTGPAGIAAALNNINLDRELALTRAMVKSGNKGERDAAVRKLGYLKSAQRLGLHPKDWMLSRVPVLPPQFRPISVMEQNHTPLVSDSNYLYKELIEADKNLARMSNQVGDDNVGDERLAVYNAFKAVTGLGDPITKQSQDRQVKGLLGTIFGSSPKFGSVQRKLIASTVDNVGRAVITPNPDLDMDSIGLPEDKAFSVYERFVVRRLRRGGMSGLDALQQVKDKTPLARQTLLEEMSNRPVIANRAPVLHKFGIMAFRPHLVKGSTLQVSPLVVKGFGADFDGDQMNYHVPVDDAASKQALELMLPSRQLLSPADFKSPMHQPSQEYTGGIYQATSGQSNRPVRTFRNFKDLKQAWLRGDIGINDRVTVLEQ